MPDNNLEALGVGLREIGDTGLKRSYGYVQQEFLNALQGDRAVKVYAEMESNDPIVGAVLYALKNIVRQVTWTTQGPQARFLEDCMGSMSHTWEDFIDEALSKLPYGWAYHEIVYQARPDGRIGWRKLPLRAQQSLCRWEFDAHGGVAGMYQNVGAGEVFIPIDKALHFRTSRYLNNPQGVSVLRAAYRPWHFKKRIEEIEAIGVERDLAGLPIAEVPVELLQAAPGTQEAAARDAIKDIVTNVRNDEQAGIVWPLAYTEQGNPLYKFSLVSSNGRRQFVTGEILARYATHIAMTSLADVVLLGHEKVGSFALSDSKESLLTTGVQSQIDEIGAVVNRHGIPRLLALNGIDEAGVEPSRRTRVVAGEVRSTNLKDLAEVVWKLSMAGMPFFPSEQFEAWIRALMDAPKSEGTELIVNPATGEKSKPGDMSEPSGDQSDFASDDE